MAETRTEKVSVVMTPTARRLLEDFAAARGWTASTAANNILVNFLAADELAGKQNGASK